MSKGYSETEEILNIWADITAQLILRYIQDSWSGKIWGMQVSVVTF